MIDLSPFEGSPPSTWIRLVIWLVIGLVIHNTDFLGVWREQMLYALEHKYLIKDWGRELPEIEASHEEEIEAALRAEGQLRTSEAERHTD